jgi:hypothetical protein
MSETRPGQLGYPSASYTPAVERRDNGDLVSYRTLRRIVGILGVTLPIVLAVWGFALRGAIELQPSISDYYFPLRTRDALVGVLFTFGWFLINYHGFDRRDDIAGNIAGICALGVALFPNSGPYANPTVHFASAAGLFLTLAYFALFLFTLSNKTTLTKQKVARNRVYRFCGVTILACIVLIAAYKLFLQRTDIDAYVPVFWLETFALWAFGLSWFVKGETVLKDK